MFVNRQAFVLSRLNAKLKSLADEKVSLDKFQRQVVKFTFSCVRSTSFPWQVYLLVCTVNKFSFDKICGLCSWNVLKHLSRVKTTFCLPKPQKYFSDTCQVQKLRRLSLEHSFLARKNCQFFCRHTSKLKLSRKKLPSVRVLCSYRLNRCFKCHLSQVKQSLWEMSFKVISTGVVAFQNIWKDGLIRLTCKAHILS